MRLLPGFLSLERQRNLLAEVRDVVARAPLYSPAMPRSGNPLSVRDVELRIAGLAVGSRRLSLQRDPSGHRRALAGDPAPDPRAVARDDGRRLRARGLPDQCYGPTAKLGLHRDEDEDAKEAPILSISLGDTALFRLGGPERKSPTRSFRLGSGDLMILEGPSRHWFHGVDRILPGTSQLLPEGGRINLTLRRVTVP